MREKDPYWYKDAILYELHVRAFFDSDGDGIGDFHGLTEKLDYLQDLGVTCLWLLPFYPSPLKDDGYDIADYTGVHPNYGTLADFRHFVQAAHHRGLHVVVELVINHTSDQHRPAPFQQGGSGSAKMLAGDTGREENREAILTWAAESVESLQRPEDSPLEPTWLPNAGCAQLLF